MEEKREILYLQETERRRISEELHDTTVQELVYLSQQLELASLYMEEDPVQARLEVLSSRRYVKHIIGGIRDIIYDLRPKSFDDIGWEASITRLYDSLVYNNDIQVCFDVENPKNDDSVTLISLYRIICEACRNVLKHAQAENMWVSMKTKDGCIRLRIRDDGIGFQGREIEKHFGLQFIRERVLLLSGQMRIETGCRGTELLIDIPVSDTAGIGYGVDSGEIAIEK
ncbi:MAG: histidine kinase [Roseburia sp.]|nr:histidine kinase [Roseburia sp.]